jgi:hypothetical protein
LLFLQATGLGVETAESLQIGYYPKDGRFLPHNDPLYEFHSGYKDAWWKLGDRIATMLIYVRIRSALSHHRCTIAAGKQNKRSYHVWIDDPIDYRCADGRFLMSPRGMAVIPTPDIFPAVKQGLMLA